MTAAATTQSANPYLDGFLAPVSAEVTATDLEVTGHIPEHLDGRYYATGPTRPKKSTRPPITGSAATAWCTG